MDGLSIKIANILINMEYSITQNTPAYTPGGLHIYTRWPSYIPGSPVDIHTTQRTRNFACHENNI